MWTTNITKGLNPSGQKIFSITYTNGARTFTESFLVESFVNNDNLNAMVQSRIAKLTKEDTDFTTIPVGAFTPVKVVTPTPPQPAVDNTAYLQQRYALVQAKQDLDMGLITQADFDAQLDTVKTLKSALATDTVSTVSTSTKVTL